MPAAEQQIPEWVERMRAAGYPVIPATRELPEEPPYVFTRVPSRRPLFRRMGAMVRGLVRAHPKNSRGNASIP